MEKNSDGRASLLSDLFKSAVGVIIPAFFTFILTVIFSFMVPDNEIRIISSLIDSKVFYLVIDNHSSSPLGPTNLSVEGAGGAKVLKQSSYAKIDIDNSSRSASTIIRISDTLPLKRTIVLITMDSALNVTTFSLASPVIGTKIVKGEDLSDSNLPKAFWASITVQSMVYFLAFTIMNYMRRKSVEILEETKDRLKDANNRFDENQIIWESKIDEMRRTVNSFKSAYTKKRIYTVRMFEQIEAENRIWRNVVLTSIKRVIADDKGAAEKIFQTILKRAGINKGTKISDVDLEFFIKALEAGDEMALQQAEDGSPSAQPLL